MIRRKNKIFALFLLLFAFLLFAFVSCGELQSSSSSQGESESVSQSSSEEQTEEKSGEASEGTSEVVGGEDAAALPEYAGSHALALPEKESACGSFTVVLDAGHGQRDPGNMAGGVKESDINLALAKRVGALLSEMGYRVLYTREDDRAMLGADPSYNTDREAEARREWAVREHADLYISIHCNAAVESARGTRLFYNDRPVTAFDGHALASCFKTALNSEFSSEIASGKLPEVKNNYVNGMQEDIYIVLQNVSLPAVLAEIGFMTNEDDLALLLDGDYLWEYAHALALGADEARKTVLHVEQE